MEYCKFCSPNAKTSPECYIVNHRNYAEGPDAYESDKCVKKSIAEDAETTMINPRAEGYHPVMKVQSEDRTEIYVSDSDIYYEWEIMKSRLKKEACGNENFA